jgi:hypothetical protein
MARTYKRDSRGRFAGGGGGSSRAGKGSKPSAAAPKPKRAARSVESRIQRSLVVQENYNRRANVSPMNPTRFRNMGKRKAQQRQALANLYEKQSPANKKRALTALKRTRVMVG